MMENPPRVTRNDGTQLLQVGGGGPTTTTTARKNRYNTSNSTTATVDEGGDLIECSGKYCRSCTAGLIADCVALCCCPCALVNILALAFVKVPWMVGRKCLGRVKKKRKSSSSRKKETMKRKCNNKSCSSSLELAAAGAEGNDHNGSISTVADNDKDGILESISNGFGEELAGETWDGGVSARFEAVEKVWLELYQDGHLSFGRVSFTGIQ